MLLNLPRDGGGEAEPELSIFQGPGESLASRGLGSGVKSPIAAMTGLGMTLLDSPVDPRLFRRAALRLGVLETGCRLPADVLLFKARVGDRVVLRPSDSRRPGRGDVEMGAATFVDMRRPD